MCGLCLFKVRVLTDVFCVVSDGVGRTGAFITMHAEMERMKAESVVDVFQFVKSTRLQRPGMMANKVYADNHIDY